MLNVTNITYTNRSEDEKATIETATAEFSDGFSTKFWLCHDHELQKTLCLTKEKSDEHEDTLIAYLNL
jgi:hypothetical protein